MPFNPRCPFASVTTKVQALCLVCELYGELVNKRLLLSFGCVHNPLLHLYFITNKQLRFPAASVLKLETMAFPITSALVWFLLAFHLARLGSRALRSNERELVLDAERNMTDCPQAGLHARLLRLFETDGWRSGWLPG